MYSKPSFIISSLKHATHLYVSKTKKGAVAGAMGQASTGKGDNDGFGLRGGWWVNRSMQNISALLFHLHTQLAIPRHSILTTKFLTVPDYNSKLTTWR